MPVAEQAVGRRSGRLAALLLIVVSGIIFLTGLGIPALWDQDEGFFAATALEMHRRNDWIVPTFNGELFGHKPPFMFWMMRLGYLICGPNEWGARLFSAVFGCGGVLLTYALARQLGLNHRRFSSAQEHGRSARWFAGDAIPVWGGLILASCLMFGVVARAATPDSYLVFWITLALLAYARSVPAVWQTTSESSATVASFNPADLWPRHWLSWLGIYAAMGVAVLVKGPIGVLLPGCTIGLFAILVQASAGTTSTGWKRLGCWLRGIFSPLIWFSFWQMRPLLAIGCVLLVAGPWFALVGWLTDGRFLIEFFGTHNVGRFLNPMDNHRGSIFYYLPATLAGFFPWSMFAIPVALLAVRRVLAEPVVSRPQLFLLCWITVVFGFFSLASTKLPSYVLPAYPALALLTADWLIAWRNRDAAIWSGWPRISWGVLALVGVAVLLGVPSLGLNWEGRSLAERVNLHPGVLGDAVPLALIGLIPLLTAAFGSWCLWRQDRSQALLSLAVGNGAFCLGLLGAGASTVDRHQFTDEIVHVADATGVQPTPLGTFCYFQPSMSFYARQPLVRCQQIAEAEAHLRDAQGLLIMTDAGRAVFEEQSECSLEVVAIRPNFPRPGDLYLVRLARSEAIQTADAIQTAPEQTESATLVPASYESP